MTRRWHAVVPLAALLALPACDDRDLTGEVGPEGQPGADGAGLLFATTALAYGDDNCPAGGERVDFGLDNGDGGETPGDGVLGPGEVDGTTFVCKGEGANPPEPIDPPEGPAGQYVIDASGGDGTTGPGGAASIAYFLLQLGSGGGHVKVFTTGEVVDTFDVPAVNPSLGENPVTVTANTTVVERAAADNTDLVNGSLVVRPALDNTLRVFNGASDDQVTGLVVEAGVTLTFDGTTGTITIVLPGAVINRGVLTTTLDGSDRRGLSMTVAAYVGDAGSSIALGGADATAGNPGGNGGALTVSANQPSPGVLAAAGTITNQGNIDTSGGNGDSGGNGGAAVLVASAPIFNTGSLTTTGGNGSVTTGGNGGAAALVASVGGIRNAGDMSTSGGTGETNGGTGGGITFSGAGGLRNGGNLSSGGGTGTTGDGATAGSISFAVMGGPIRNGADLSARGGSAPAGNGGSGGVIIFQVNDFSSALGPVPAGSIEVSGNLDSSGGDGTTGGSASPIYAVILTTVPVNQEVVLYGYTDVLANGGNGADGGNGGQIAAACGPTASGNLPSGSVIIDPVLSANGGNGTNGAGGNGGTITLIAQVAAPGVGLDQQRVLVGGDISASGGTGTTVGGSGGTLAIQAFDGLSVASSLTLNGGAGVTAGGLAGAVQATSFDGPVSITGALISAAGGACTEVGCSGGDGGPIVFGALELENSANFAVGGGDANTGGGSGGGAGNIALDALEGTAISTATSVDILGGTGATPGTNGTYFVGGVDSSGPFLP